MSRAASRGVEHPAGLLAQRRLDFVVGEHSRRRPGLGCLQAVALRALPLSGSGQLGGDLGEERPYLVLVEAPEADRELLAGHLLGAESHVVHSRRW